MRAQQVSVHARAVDAGDVVVLDRQGHGLVDVALEGQVHIPFGQHQRAIDAAGGGKGQYQSAGPVGERARPAGVSPVAAAHRALKIDAQVGARRRRYAHGPGRTQALEVDFDLLLGLLVRQETAQGLRVLVADVENARLGQPVALDDGRQLGRVHQPLDSAVDDQRRRRQGGDHGRAVLDGRTGPGGSRQRLATAEHRGQRQHEAAPAEPGGRQARHLHEHGATLCFTENGHLIARLKGTAAQHGLKGVDPRGFDPLLQHVVSSKSDG